MLCVSCAPIVSRLGISGASSCSVSTTKLESCIEEFEEIQARGLSRCDHDLLTCKNGGHFVAELCDISAILSPVMDAWQSADWFSAGSFGVQHYDEVRPPLAWPKTDIATCALSNKHFIADIGVDLAAAFFLLPHPRAPTTFSS